MRMKLFVAVHIFSMLVCLSGSAYARPLGASVVDDPLASVDCVALRVDFVRLLPDLITPQKLAIKSPPFDEAAIAKTTTAAERDPNGLCQYRDANRALLAPTPNRVVFFGDSITEYWALAAPGLFTGDIIDRGVSGQSTSQMLVRFHRDVIELKPRVVHILAGINDPISAGGSLSTRTNIVAMVTLAKANGIKVILGSLTPSTGFWLAPGVKLAPEIASLNAWLKSYAASQGLIFVDYHSALVGSGGAIRDELSNEGLHPNRSGYALMTPLAIQAISRAKRTVK